MHVDRISMLLSILYLKVLQIEGSKLRCISVIFRFVFFASSADTNEMLHLHCLPKYLMMVTRMKSTSVESFLMFEWPLILKESNSITS